jgi:hypothetical protein
MKNVEQKIADAATDVKADLYSRFVACPRVGYPYGGLPSTTALDLCK